MSQQGHFQPVRFPPSPPNVVVVAGVIKPGRPGPYGRVTLLPKQTLMCVVS